MIDTDIHTLRKSVKSQILDWAAALEMNADITYVSDKMKEYANAL